MKKVATTLIIISTVFLGFGFVGKNQHLPGASIAFILGSTLSIFAMIFYFIARYQNKNDVKIATYSVYFYFFTMCLGTSFMVNNGSKDLLNAFVMIEHGIMDGNAQIQKNIQSINHPILSKELNAKTQEIIKFINEQKSYLISITGGVDYNGIPFGKSNQDVAASHFLVTEGGFYGNELQRLLKEHQSLAFGLLENDFNKIIRIDFNDYPEPNDPTIVVPWTNRQVEHLPMSSVLTNLTLLQNQVLQTNLTVLNHLNQ